MNNSSLVSSYYKTVPLDEAGATDNETPRLPAPGMVLDLPDEDITESMVVNVDSMKSSFVDTNDFNEVMSILDEQNVSLGTSWRELRMGSAKKMTKNVSRKTSTNLDFGKVSIKVTLFDYRGY